MISRTPEIAGARRTCIKKFDFHFRREFDLVQAIDASIPTRRGSDCTTSTAGHDREIFRIPTFNTSSVTRVGGANLIQKRIQIACNCYNMLYSVYFFVCECIYTVRCEGQAAKRATVSSSQSARAAGTLTLRH